jgi:hypothetical protein
MEGPSGRLIEGPRNRGGVVLNLVSFFGGSFMIFKKPF